MSSPLSRKISRNLAKDFRSRRKNNKKYDYLDLDSDIIYEAKIDKDDEIDKEWGLSVGWKGNEIALTNKRIGVGIDIAGVGLKVSTENGGTVGVGVGVMGVEYDAKGGGKVEYLNGLYEMKVEKVGCTYVKDFYAGGIYTHTEIQEIPGCDEKEDTSEKRLDDVDKKTESFDYEIPDIPSTGFWCPVIKVTGSWNDLYWFSFPTSTGESASFDGYTVTATVIDWISSNSGLYRDWLEKKVDEGYFSYSGGGFYRKEIHFEQKGTIGNTIDFDNLTLSWREDGLVRNESPLPGAYARILYPPWPWIVYSTAPEPGEERVHCTSSIKKPPVSNQNKVRSLSSKRFRRTQRAINMNKKCCFTEDDRALLQLNTLALGSLNFPGQITVDEDRNLTANFPTEATDNLINDHVGLKFAILQLLLSSNQETSSEKLDKLAEMIGLPVPNTKVDNVGSESYKPTDQQLGFPIEIPDYVNQPRRKDGTWEKDLNKYPKRKINNLRELELYKLEMQQHLYRFSSALPTLTDGLEMEKDLWFPASEGQYEYPTTISGIISRVINILDYKGLPKLSATIQATDGEIPAEPLENKDILEAFIKDFYWMLQKITRVQVTVTKISNAITALHKILVLIKRLIQLIINGIGIPYRETTSEDPVEKTGQPEEIKTEFNTTEFIEKGFNPVKNQGNEEKIKAIDDDGTDIDRIQDETNKFGIIRVKGFVLKDRTVSLWFKLTGRSKN
ncbi:MAG: hypothetical protein QNJ68_10345 [Microcoleaceae cyanobacterium MO_207.B10]|nr:hypothetical protein [Microcoleaceae cyanobacterium MO_207.B10]